MTQDTQVQPVGNGNGTGAEEQPKATDRDVQRQALRALVLLSEQCAADEADIQKRHDEGMAAEATAFERNNWRAEQQGKAAEDAVKQKYEERLGKIQAQFDADTAAIREAHEKG